MSWFDLAAEIEPSLRAGDLVECTSRVSAAMGELPESPFHIVRDLDFTNDPGQVAAQFEKFISLQSHYQLAAVYTETNGFDINPGRWYFDVFGYASYGGHEDYDWLSEWESKRFPEITLTGMERLQAVYDSAAFRDSAYDEASGLASLLVVIKFQSLIKRSAGQISSLEVPLLATSHDYDFIYEFAPMARPSERSLQRARSSASRPAWALKSKSERTMSHFVLIEGGTVDGIIEATRAYGQLSSSSSRISYQVSVWDLEDNCHLLSLPSGAHAYDLCNLINWLGDPASVPGVTSSCGWFHNRSEEFYFRLDPSRSSGDTLLGATERGKGVQLYLPEIILAEHPAVGFSFKPAPSSLDEGPVAEFSYDTEDVGEAMNPALLNYSELSDIPGWDESSKARTGCASSLVVAILNLFRSPGL